MLAALTPAKRKQASSHAKGAENSDRRDGFDALLEAGRREVGPSALLASAGAGRAGRATVAAFWSASLVPSDATRILLSRLVDCYLHRTPNKAGGFAYSSSISV